MANRGKAGYDHAGSRLLRTAALESWRPQHARRDVRAPGEQRPETVDSMGMSSENGGPNMDVTGGQQGNLPLPPDSQAALPQPVLPQRLEASRAPTDKSPGVAFGLTLVLGPIGLLYVNVSGALLLTFVALFGIVTFGIAAGVAWAISMVWGCVEATRAHSKFQMWLATSSASIGPPATVPVSTPQLVPPAQPPGWLSDPGDPTLWRWWDGGGWTDTTHPRSETPPPPSA